jgi:hypothetical protein
MAGIMYAGTGGGSSSGGALAVRDDNIFADTASRNDFFISNPTRLARGINVSVGSELQRWDGTAWLDITPVIKGAAGASQPAFKLQYSVNGTANWSDTMNLALHRYWRWSYDGGVTWSADNVQFSGEGTSQYPAPYTLTVGGNGKLQLRKSGVLIQEQDEYGSWISTSVTTGTGSFHLGAIHSIGSGGENVLTLNSDSNIAYYPVWSGISTDGATVLNASSRHYGPLLIGEPNGVLSTANVNYDHQLNVLVNAAFFFVDIVPAENYTGKIVWRAVKSTGKEIATFTEEVALVSGTLFRLQFRYPLWAISGQSFTLTIKKESGAALLVKAGASNTSLPYRKSGYRIFGENEVFSTSNPEIAASALNTLTGASRISFDAIKGTPDMSETVKGMAKVGAGLTMEGGVLSANAFSSEKVVVESQAAMLALPVNATQITTALRTDISYMFYLNKGVNPAILSNWIQGQYFGENMISFKSRVGAVVPLAGDYDQTMINTKHDATGKNGKLGIDANGIYWEELA